MKFGFPISLLFHAVMLFAGLVLFRGEIKPLDTGEVIPVELLSIADITNVRAAIKRPEPSPKPLPKPEEPMALETPMENAPEEADEVQERTEDPSEPDTPEPAEEISDEVEKVAEAPKEPEKPSFDLNRISDFVNKTRETAPEKNQQVALQSETNFYEFADVTRSASGEGTGLSVTMLDRLQTEMLRCWRESRDAVNPESLVVKFQVRFFPDGYVESVKMLAESGSGPYAAVARQRAAAAIKKCEPYDFLPADKYSGWRDMTLSFRPRGA